MTVAELIEILKTKPQDMMVVFNYSGINYALEDDDIRVDNDCYYIEGYRCFIEGYRRFMEPVSVLTICCM